MHKNYYYILVVFWYRYNEDTFSAADLFLVYHDNSALNMKQEKVLMIFCGTALIISTLVPSAASHNGEVSLYHLTFFFIYDETLM